MASFAERLKELRKKKDVGQKEVGAVIGLSESSVGKYEAGKQTPDPTAIIKLADYFSVSIDYLLGRSDDDLRIEDLYIPTMGDLYKTAEGYLDPKHAKTVEEIKKLPFTEQHAFLTDIAIKLYKIPETEREVVLKFINSLSSSE